MVMLREEMKSGNIVKGGDGEVFMLREKMRRW